MWLRKKSLLLGLVIAALVSTQCFGAEPATGPYIVAGSAACRSDWGPAIQSAIDRCGQLGIYFPEGLYKISTPIHIRRPGVTITGPGSPRPKNCILEWHGPAEQAMFNFCGLRDSPSHGFSLRDIGVRARPAGATAFRFGPEINSYSRGYHFENVGVGYFRKVFDFTATRGKCGQWGDLTIERCSFCYNGQVIDATGWGLLNEWRIRDSFVEKNGLSSEHWEPAYAIDVKGGDNATLQNVVLEGQPRAVRVRKHQGFRIEGCRFEGNACAEARSTDPVCLIQDSNGVYLQIYNRVLKAENKPEAPAIVRLQDCHDYEVAPMYGRVEIFRHWEPRF